MAREGAARIGRWTLTRRIVQVAMLALFCLPLAVAGWGLFGAYAGGDVEVATPADGVFFGSLSSSTIGGVALVDPFAALQAVVASKTLSAALLVGALPVLAVYGIVRGRAFCGWVCPVNLVLEGVDWLRRKLGLRVAERVLPRRAKVGVAAAVLVLSALVGIPLFELVSPVGAVNKGLLFGALAGVWTLAAIVVAELVWGRRVWCRAVCPLGGFYEVLGRAGQVNVGICHEKCTQCGACVRACIADPEILQPALAGRDVIVRAGDCMACGACVDACPTRALAFRLGRPRRPAAPEAPGEPACPVQVRACAANTDESRASGG